jgi:hypothetical protein
VPSQSIEDLGIHDAASGAAAARASRERILEPATATQMIEAENPHAAFTLLRAYAENTAAILYAKDHPNRVDHFWDTEGHGVKIGTITNYADKRFEGFKGIYDQLSKFAHPQALGVLASSSITDDYTLRWSSAPHFKRPEDQLTAYAYGNQLLTPGRTNAPYHAGRKYQGVAL